MNILQDTVVLIFFGFIMLALIWMLISPALLAIFELFEPLFKKKMPWHIENLPIKTRKKLYNKWKQERRNENGKRHRR